eukprot:9695890-Lingulodinium_polyedra.AAC.1
MRRPLRPSLGDLDAFAGWRKLQAWRQLPGKSKDRRGSRRGHLDVSPTCDKCSQVPKPSTRFCAGISLAFL